MTNTTNITNITGFNNMLTSSGFTNVELYILFGLVIALAVLYVYFRDKQSNLSMFASVGLMALGFTLMTHSFILGIFPAMFGLFTIFE